MGNKIIGATMIAMVFVGIFLVGGIGLGFIKTAMVFVGTGVLVAWIFLAVYLLESADD